MASLIATQQGGDTKALKEAWEETRSAFFPYRQHSEKSEVNKLKEVMAREQQRGPMTVTPLADPDRHKIASKLERGERQLQAKAAMKRTGQAVDLDPFEKRKRRRG